MRPLTLLPLLLLPFTTALAAGGATPHAAASPVERVVGVSGQPYLMLAPAAARAPELSASPAPAGTALPLGQSGSSQFSLVLGGSGSSAATQPALATNCLLSSAAVVRGGCVPSAAWLGAGNATGSSAALSIGRPNANFSVALSAARADSLASDRANFSGPVIAAVSPQRPVAMAPLGLQMEEYSLTATGMWSFEWLGALSVSGGVGEALVHSPLRPQQRLDRSQGTVAIGVSRGPISGSLVGRAVNDVQAGYPPVGWFGLDLGVSWRMPWRAELSFGARNLLSSGGQALLPDPGVASRDDRRERTPYIEYRQDF